MPARLRAVDPFDLPDVLGTADVVWRADDGLAGHLVRGCLEAADGPGCTRVPCDLLAVDEAFPAPVADDAARLLTHQAWQHQQVHLASRDDRLTLLVPGRGFTADLVLETVTRLTKALGARPQAWSVRLRLGR